MSIEKDTIFIDLQNIVHISRGDSSRLLKYLNQFLELVPPRIEELEESLKAGDRKMIRQILHKMSPQLQFFGIPDIVAPIQRLEFEYETIPLAELETLVKEILAKLEGAEMEVERIIESKIE